jgi:hypothetical protein
VAARRRRSHERLCRVQRDGQTVGIDCIASCRGTERDALANVRGGSLTYERTEV